MLYHFSKLVIGLIVLGSIFLGACTTNFEPAETTTPIQIVLTKTPTLSLTPTASPLVTPSPPILPAKTPTQEISSLNASPLDFPLNLGNSWVYSSTHYDTYETERITATYTVTETVINTQTDDPYYIIQMRRDKALVTSSVNLDTLDRADFYLDGTGGTETYWYIISGTHVYLQQSELDLTTVESSWLEYVFPLEENQAWYPDEYQRSRFSVETGPTAGLRLTHGPTRKSTSIGAFENCFEVLTVYNSGGVTSWFCPRLGVVESAFDHVGTPFGYRTMLITYSIRSP